MKKVMRLLLFLVLFSVVFFRVNNILVFDYNPRWKVDDRNKQILSKDFEHVDAVFIGGSRMQVAVSPIILWEETGIVSYNLASNSQPPLMTKLILDRFIEEVNPTVVFMDLPGLISEADPSNVYSSNQYVLAFQLLNSPDYKKEAINILNHRYDDFNDKMFRFPFYKDHSRWKMLTRQDFVGSEGYHKFLMGGVNEEGMKDPDLSIEARPSIQQYEADYNVNEYAYQDYLETIQSLKEKDIDVVLLLPPFAERPNHVLLHAITDFAEKQDLMVLDYNVSENFDRIGFRNKNDFYDNGHVSITGSYKFTKAIAKDIQDMVELKEKTPEEEMKLESYLRAYQDYYVERAKAFE